MPDLTDPHLVLLPVLIPLLAAAVCLLLRHQPWLRGVVALLAQSMSLAASVALFWQVWQAGQPMVFAVNHALAKSAMLMIAGAITSRSPVKRSSF